MTSWIVIAAMLVPSLSHASTQLAQLDYITEDYKPYNYTDESGNPTGLAVELLHMVWKNLGMEAQSIKILPWARGYYLLTNKPNVVLFSTARTQAREGFFKWACSISHLDYIILSLKEQNITLTSFSQLNNYQISLVRAEATEQMLTQQYGVNDSNIIKAKNLNQALRLLINKRVDLLAVSKQVGYDTIHEMNLNKDDFNVTMELSSEQLCYAFSHQVDDLEIQRFQRALTRAVSSSAFLRLQAKYSQD